MTIVWRYANAEHSILIGTHPSGKQESHLVDCEDGRRVLAAETVADYVAPLLPAPAELEAQCAAALNGGGSVDLLKLVKAVALWQASLHGVTAAQARSAIAAIYKTL